MPEIPEADSTFGLDQVLKALRRDLKSAQKAAEGDPLGLFVQQAEVELAFTVERSKSAGGGINLKVFGVGADAGGKRGTTSETVHRIKLTLSPEEWVQEDRVEGGGGKLAKRPGVAKKRAPAKRPAAARKAVKRRPGVRSRRVMAR